MSDAYDIGREDGERFERHLLEQLQDLARAAGVDVDISGGAGGGHEGGGAGAGGGYRPAGGPAGAGRRRPEAPTERYDSYDRKGQEQQETGPSSQPQSQSPSQAPTADAEKVAQKEIDRIKAAQPSAEPVDAKDQVPGQTSEEGAPGETLEQQPGRQEPEQVPTEEGGYTPREQPAVPQAAVPLPSQRPAEANRAPYTSEQRTTGADHDRAVDDYLWQVYQRSPKKDQGGNFGWKDEEAAKRAGMSTRQYTIGGMSRELKNNLYTAMKEREAQGHTPELNSAFRDDYRQSIASGFKAKTGFSRHGGSRATAGYGKGEAADVDRGTADAIARSRGAYGLDRPMPSKDPVHVQAHDRRHLTSGADDQRRDGEDASGGAPQAPVTAPQRLQDQSHSDKKAHESGYGSGMKQTFYAPGAKGKMEGPYATSRINPNTGTKTPTTLDDVRQARAEGRDIPVSLAGDPRRYGQEHNIGTVRYKGADGQMYTLDNVKGHVHDTGSAFRGRMNKLDIASMDARGMTGGAAAKHMAGNKVMPDAPPGVTPVTPAVSRGLSAAGEDPRGGSLGTRTDGRGIPEINVEGKAPKESEGPASEKDRSEKEPEKKSDKPDKEEEK